MSVKKPVNIASFLAVVSWSFCIVGPAAFAQGLSASSSHLSPAEIDRIIKAFTAKESQFRQALNQYSFKRDASFRVWAWADRSPVNIIVFRMFTFDDQGNRFEKISYFPMPSIRRCDPGRH